MKARIALSGFMIALMFVACGGPTISRGTLPPEGKSIRRWQLRSDQEIRQVGKFNSEQSEPAPVPQSRIDSLAADYMQEVRNCLREKYAIEFFDNPPFEGTITIRLEGEITGARGGHRKYTLVEPADDKRLGTTHEKVPERIITHRAFLPSRIEKVGVIFSSLNGKILGDAQLLFDLSKGLSQEAVKPKDVAKVIAEMLK